MSFLFRSYREASAYLDLFICYEKSPPPKYCEKTHYQLDRFRRLLAGLDNPHQSLRCIHIAGTNGKGSTSAFLAALLQASGYRVGLYTSPHLFSYTERIQVNGKPIGKGKFARLISLLSEHLEALILNPPPDLRFFATVFELLTAAAFLHFQNERVDFAVIETGLGGRLDATNVLHPLLTILTPIDREHTNLLGRTLRKIASEKAGIIKPGCPVLLFPQKPAVSKVITERCQDQKSPSFRISQYLQYDNIEPHKTGYTFRLRAGKKDLGTFCCPLAGRHQIQNFTAALLASQYLFDNCSGEPRLPQSDVLDRARSLKVSWPARTEIHSLPGGSWIFDAAHSPQAARCLRSVLDDLFSGQPVSHLIAFSRDKNVAAYARELVRPGDTLFCYQSSHPRAMPLNRLLHRFQRIDLQAGGGPDVDKLLSSSSNKKRIYCVSGSLFWVADVMTKLTSRELL